MASLPRFPEESVLLPHPILLAHWKRNTPSAGTTLSARIPGALRPEYLPLGCQTDKALYCLAVSIASKPYGPPAGGLVACRHDVLVPNGIFSHLSFGSQTQRGNREP